MKQLPIVLMVEHNIKNILLMSEHNYTDKSNLLGKQSLLIYHSGSIATILWSDDWKKLKIKVRTIDIVMKFNSFTRKDYE